MAQASFKHVVSHAVNYVGGLNRHAFTTLPSNIYIYVYVYMYIYICIYILYILILTDTSNCAGMTP